MRRLFAILFVLYPLYVEAQSLSVSSATVPPGGSLTVNWRDVKTPMPGDWIGIYQSGTSDNALVAKAWVFTSCTQTQGRALSVGSCSFQVPAVPIGVLFELRLFANQSLQRLAVSNSFEIQAPLLPKCGTVVLSSYGATYIGQDLPLAGKPYVPGSYPFPFTVPSGRMFLVSSIHHQGKRLMGADGVVRFGGAVIKNLFTINTEAPIMFPVPLPIPAGVTLDGYFGNDTPSEPMNQILIIIGELVGADC